MTYSDRCFRPQSRTETVKRTKTNKIEINATVYAVTLFLFITSLITLLYGCGIMK